MHVDIRFGNKEHFGELQKKVYSRVVTPQNQFCFFPILYKLLFGCYSDHAVREFSIQIEIFVDMISCFMPLPVYCYFSQNKPVFFSLQKISLIILTMFSRQEQKTKILLNSASLQKCENARINWLISTSFLSLSLFRGKVRQHGKEKRR